MRKMLDQSSLRVAAALLIATFLTSHLLVTVSARYLPTRSQDDRLEKLRELLKDLLEGDMERRGANTGIDYGDLLSSGRSPIYKRSASPYPSTPERMMTRSGHDVNDGLPFLKFSERRNQDIRNTMQ